MTTSTEAAKPAPKAKGPIRTGAVVPVLIVFVLSFIYFHFFFDRNMRSLVEWTASYVHGAEVNLDKFETHFLQGSLSMRNLQVTDKEKPTQNLIQIGEIRFAFLWDALLRLKFVVNESAIEDIQVYSPRSHAGFVKPPEPPSNKPSAMAELEQNVLNQTKKEYSGNVLGDIAGLLEGTDKKDLLKNIQSQLKSEETIKALQAELKTKEQEWKARIEKFPKKEEFEDLGKRAKALKFNSKDPKQFAADLKEASKIKKEADAKFDEIKTSGRDLKGDLEKFNGEFHQLDDIIKQDVKDLESRLKIPNLDMQDFSKNIFGPALTQNLVSIQKYMELARKYMPPKKDAAAAKEKELIPPARGKGKTYTFPITTSYPLFWLKHAAISSKANAGGFAGNVTGELTNVTTSPSTIGKPAILSLNGDFPKAEVYGALLRLTIDHVSVPQETIEFGVNQFAVKDKPLVQDDSLTLGLKRASGDSNFTAKLREQELMVAFKTQFKAIEYDLQSKSGTVKDAISTILAGIPTVDLNAGATGTWGHLNTYLNSNLGRELSAGLKRYVQARVDEMKAKVRQVVDEKIKGQKDQLDGEYGKLKGQIDSLVKSKTDEVDKAKNDLKADGKSQSAGSKEKVKNDLKERGKKLLKGFKF